MGDFLGHAVPGAMFLSLSLWWFLGALIRTQHPSRDTRGLHRSSGPVNTRLKSRTYAPVWFQCPGKTLSKIPIEPIVKVILGILGVLGELVLSKAWTLINKDGDFVAENLNNHSHTAMYCFFALSGIVDLMMWYNLIPLPPKCDYLIFSACFWVEGFLFYFHLHGHSEISVRLHTILYIVIFVTAAAFLADVFSTRQQSLFTLMRAILLGLQGTWFLQIAFVLYGPSPWKNTPSNVEFLAVAFAWHLFIFLAVSLVLVTMFNRFCGKKFPADNLLEETISDEEAGRILLETSWHRDNKSRVFFQQSAKLKSTGGLT